MSIASRLTTRNLVMIFFLVLSVFLLVALVKQITLLDIQRLARQVGAREFVVLAGIYLLMAYFRGIRLGYVIREPDHMKMTAIAAIHAFLNLVLPFRLGELSLPYLVKVFTNKGFGAGSVSLVVVRLYDAVTIAFLSILSLMLVDVGGSRVEGMLWIAAGAIIVIFAVVFSALGLILRTAGALACKILRVSGRSGRAGGEKLNGLVQTMNKEIDGLDFRQKYVFLPATSLAVIGLTYTMFYLVMVFIGIDIGFFLNMLASLGELVTTFLPNALGSFGTLEAGWAAGYMLCGVTKSDAIASGFIMHGVVILAGMVLSLLGAIYLAAQKSRNGQAGPA